MHAMVVTLSVISLPSSRPPPPHQRRNSAIACGVSPPAKQNFRCWPSFLSDDGVNCGGSLTVSRVPLPPLRELEVSRLRDHGLRRNMRVITRKIPSLLGNDFSQHLSQLLPFSVAATAAIALLQPRTFTWVSQDLYAPALGGIMLSIGIGMSVQDFTYAFQRPLPLSIGFFGQYALKPLLAVIISKVFRMPTSFSAGFILMSCVSMAQLSNYASFICRGDTALSIVLTSSTTVASAFLTPLATGLLLGSVVPIDIAAMSRSILQVVLVPVFFGLALNAYAKPVVAVMRRVMPIFAMFCTSICIGGPLAINRDQVLSMKGLQLVLPVMAFHSASFVFGYWLCKIPGFGLDEKVSMTTSLCMGMQSSTLAGLLAMQFLDSPQALPPACSVVLMAIMGLSIASFWGHGFQFLKLPNDSR